MESPIMKYFAYDHLPQRLQIVSKPAAELALAMDETLQNGPEKSAGLRKLLEAKDCFVRASLGVLIFVLLLSFPAAAQNPRYAMTGSIVSSSSTISINSRDYALATVTMHGTYAGVTVFFEFSDDNGATWYADTCVRSDAAIMETSEAVASNASREWDCGIAATTTFRVRATAYTSGTASVGITMTQDQIEPAITTSGAITDGVNSVAIKASSTAAAAADPSLAVALSPNSPLPATSSANQAVSTVFLNAAGAATVVKGTAGNLFGMVLVNNNAAVVYVEFFNTASVTLGTTTPVLTIPIAASATITIPPSDLAMINNNTAIYVAAVTAYNGASTGSVTGQVFYK